MCVFNQAAYQPDQPLLILDIDETLLFAATQPLAHQWHYKAERTWIYKRPYVDEFLDYCATYFQMGVWTSARDSYAQEIFSQVFPNLSLLFIFSEMHCVNEIRPNGETVSVKSLTKLTDYGVDLKRVLMIDDSREKHYQNPANLIEVKPYLAETEGAESEGANSKGIKSEDANSKDNELMLLKTFLGNVREQQNFLILDKAEWRHSVSNRQEH